MIDIDIPYIYVEKSHGYENLVLVYHLHLACLFT